MYDRGHIHTFIETRLTGWPQSIFHDTVNE